MPPRYPFSRNQPSSSSNSASNNNADRPIVVSASGRAPTSPAVGSLQADSPSTLRARIPSPRNILAGFSNETSTYPSPSDLIKGKSKKKGRGMVKSKAGWVAIQDDSPGSSKGGDTPKRYQLSDTPTRGQGAPAAGIPRYDARGYPARNRPPDNGNLSPESAKSLLRFENGYGGSAMTHSKSDESLGSVSSTGAGVNEETESVRMNRFANRPSSYYAASDAPSSATMVYPPALSYNMPGYNPYDNGYGYGNGRGRTSPLPSLYGDDRASIHSTHSGDSMTYFKRQDALQDHYGAFSISSKGGKKHIVDSFNLPADPATWSYLGPEPDDDFHDPDIRPSRRTRIYSSLLTVRGASNVGCLVLLLFMTVGLFAGYPITYHFFFKSLTTSGAYNLGGVNSTGQLPNVGPFQLIDKDTPQSAYTKQSLETGETWNLVFSDEFNRAGRTFYDGDDPYWEAVDLHYWQTNNLEWYDPSYVTTKNGHLEVKLSNVATNGMNYTGASAYPSTWLMTVISTWNRFCFTGGYVEASVSLPGKSNVYGLWPAIWSMGNLGRAGYGGSLDGLWPYSYDSCDVGTLKNQSLNGLPAVTTTTGDPAYDNSLSYLPGQRLSACTCPSDTTHPGPKHANGSFVGRGAPEIDMFEATVDSTTLIGEVSQSGQWAPFNPYYGFLNTSSSYYQIYNTSNTVINPYQGGVYQQATSGLSYTNQNCYTQDTGCYSIYGFEYQPGANGYISWVSGGKKAWTIQGSAMGPNAAAGVGQRIVSVEPMYLIINLGLSQNFGNVDFEGLLPLWPITMNVDYIRVYQDPNNRNIGCNPPDYPTASYIAMFPEAYSNPNITVENQVPGLVVPKNRLTSSC